MVYASSVTGDREPSSIDLARAPFRALLAASLALGALLRGLHLYQMRYTPFFEALILDARAYDAWAQRIAGGELIGSSAFWIDPLYAYVLGATYAIFGHDLMMPRVLNAVLGLATAWLVASTAQRVMSSRIAALASCALVCLFVPAIHFESQIEKTALTVFLMALLLELYSIGTQRALIGAGIVAGLATLARGNMVLFIPIGALALWRGWDREPGDGLVATAALGRKRALTFVACALPVVALATAHNALASGELVPTTTNFGINLYIGNQADNETGTYSSPPFVRPTTQTEQPDFRAEAERRTGETFNDRQLSSYWAGQAVRYAWAEPLASARLTWRKLYSVLHNDEIPDSEAVELFAHWSKVVGAPLVWFGQLIPLAVLGGVVCLRRRGARVLVAVAGLYVLSLVPFFVLARLRMPLLPPLAVLAGGAVAWLVAAFDAEPRRTRELAQAGALLALVAVFCVYQPEWMKQRTTGGLAIGWHNLGASLEQRGRLLDAARAFEHAIEVNDRAVPGSLRALGAYYQRQGDLVRAERMLRRLVEVKPDSASGRASWRSVLNAQIRQGDAQHAFEVLQEAVKDGPYDEDLHYLLGQTMVRQASAQAMVDFFSAEAEHDQKPQTSHYFWAVGLARLGDLKGARAQLDRALEIDPAHEMSQHRIGALLEQQSDLEGALEHYEEAARIYPDFKEALNDAARVAQQLGRAELASNYQRRAALADPNSPRRYVYWARYLAQHGRTEAALVEVARMLAERPDDAEAIELRARIVRGDALNSDQGAGGSLSEEQTTRLTKVLAASGSGGLIKIVYDERFASAQALATSLSKTFSDSSWTVRMDRAPFPLKPGIVALAATHPAAESSEIAISALQAASLQVSYRTGYGEYADEMRKTNPSWLGFSFAPDEALLVAIGDIH